ncbi:iron-containing alcohol dehydrogenase [Photobacterium sanguinicancri]|uniref:Iron-containing alcohol dehydrogenase n=1 Tax=Photobacterium sanguinicancri TaxID=875932 RepID=A0AAW7YC48_9GAMM|nr:iron-containing alcohol dehydrogenase [Photobacterium sanguinicancri]MDO6544225.1 iron-containing alcohol dehydrogenase [Photobacterium sanguinicancri]
MWLHKALIGINKQLNKLVPIPFPELHYGSGCIADAASYLNVIGVKKALIVTDKMLVSLGIVDKLIESFDKHRLEYVVFDGVMPDPTIATVDDGVEAYLNSSCDAIVALGGGSPIDCAKIIGAKVVKNTDVKALSGKLKVRKKLPPFMAIPTTAGTGSEVTIAAVITDPTSRSKFAVIDPVLVPRIALLDAELMVGLPKVVTAATGMDALTHAIEAYLGSFSNAVTDRYAREAIVTIFEQLPRAYMDGTDLYARESMAMASYQAGCAFTRAFVGYVHAIAHQLGGFYHIPHGLANAVLLPYVLRFSVPACRDRMSELAALIGLVEGENFIEAVERLNQQLDIPTSFTQLLEEDIPEIAKRALSEAHGTYPVPRYMTQSQCETLLKQLLP